MLCHTFIHLRQVGPVTERALWRAGVTTWDEFLQASSLPSRLQARRAELQDRLQRSVSRFQENDAAFFDRCLPSGERWRVYAEFRQRAAFLDIETTGLSPEYSYITMVGILDCRGYTAYIRGENLEDLREALEQYSLIVTYNGAAFDLPYVEHEFGRVFGHTAHIDLRYPLRRLGFRGGLKSIEKQAGAGRPSDLSDLDGFDAVLLWRMWLDGDHGARDTLIRYNAEDVASLPGLAEIVYNRLASRLPVACRPVDSWPERAIDLPYDMGALERLRRIHASPRVR